MLRLCPSSSSPPRPTPVFPDFSHLLRSTPPFSHWTRGRPSPPPPCPPVPWGPLLPSPAPLPTFLGCSCGPICSCLLLQGLGSETPVVQGPDQASVQLPVSTVFCFSLSWPTSTLPDSPSAPSRPHCNGVSTPASLLSHE